MSKSVHGSDTVLLIDDQIGDLMWLVDRIEDMGFHFACATNEREARTRLEAIARGEEVYVLAVVDVAMATHDFFSVQEVDQRFIESSKDSGIRLCRYAREELRISPEMLPIAVFTARTDQKVKEAIGALDGVQLFVRHWAEGEGSLDHYITGLLEKAKEAGALETSSGGENR